MELTYYLPECNIVDLPLKIEWQILKMNIYCALLFLLHVKQKAFNSILESAHYNDFGASRNNQRLKLCKSAQFALLHFQALLFDV